MTHLIRASTTHYLTVPTPPKQGRATTMTKTTSSSSEPGPLLTRAFIGGEWVDADTGRTFDVDNPATSRVIASVADSGRSDIRSALDSAEQAQREWGDTTAEYRAELLVAASEIMRQERENIARIITVEQGKTFAQALSEIDRGRLFLNWFAEEGRRAYGRTIPAPAEDKRILCIKRPVGITVAITPWNYPAIQILRKIGAALAAGCVSVIKPAELTPLTALKLASCFERAGFPAGTISVLPTADPATFSDVVMHDERVRAVSFTGSTEVGKILIRASADQVKKLSLELGGHSPVLVFESADISRAARLVLTSKITNAGQVCIAASRVLVQRSIGEEFVKELRRLMESLRVGDPFNPDVHVGPLVDQNGVKKVEHHIADAVSKGAKIETGGTVIEDPRLGNGNYFRPTILTDVNESMVATQEETFGPVALIDYFEDESEAIRRANSSSYGLAGYVFTSDLNQSIRLSEKLECGALGINEVALSAIQAPFGGIKQSGFGKEGGYEGLDEYLDTKYVLIGGV